MMMMMMMMMEDDDDDHDHDDRFHCCDPCLSCATFGLALKDPMAPTRTCGTFQVDRGQKRQDNFRKKSAQHPRTSPPNCIFYSFSSFPMFSGYVQSSSIFSFPKPPSSFLSSTSPPLGSPPPGPSAPPRRSSAPLPATWPRRATSAVTAMRPRWSHGLGDPW